VADITHRSEGVERLFMSTTWRLFDRAPTAARKICMVRVLTHKSHLLWRTMTD